ncbi:MAG: AAA family ATPase [Deltaproteobacteria bacterium]|jgi:hypothetical protein|nr:AAA family ATPase [Deltaproteobacteria bacterium]
MQSFPLDQRSFANIIDQNLLYADKTRYIYKLTKKWRSDYFLARPGRFGKTLLLDTLAELFTGKRERFQGLWLDRSDYAFPRIPVLRLTLSLGSESPAILERNLLGELKRITAQVNLAQPVPGETAALYFGNLIQAFGQESRAKIALLIDDYDSPVTSNLNNPNLAAANAKILRGFLSVSRKRPASRWVRFSFITGEARYAALSFDSGLDSGPQPPLDLSLDPRYAGLTGFSQEEFDSLFADRMESTLTSLKKIGQMSSSATLSDLREIIFLFSGGHNWGGSTRALNPFIILDFFERNRFESFWGQSEWPTLAPSLMRKRPLDFLEALRKSCLAKDLRQADLAEPEVVPALFHSGLLTVDSVKKVKTVSPVAQEVTLEDRYSFRLPNLMALSAYYQDRATCLRDVLGLSTIDELKFKGTSLQQAFLARDAVKVSSIFGEIFSAISLYQKPAGEMTGQALIQAFLLALGIQVRGGIPGSPGRWGLSVELPGQNILILGVKYRPIPSKIRSEKENADLASLAWELLTREEALEGLSRLVSGNFQFEKDKIVQILPHIHKNSVTISNRKRLMGKAVQKSFPQAEINKALAELVFEKFSRAELNQELLSRGVAMDLSSEPGDLADEEIERILTQAAQEALRDIVSKDYLKHSYQFFNFERKDFFELAIAIHERDFKVKAVFGHVRPTSFFQALVMRYKKL